MLFIYYFAIFTRLQVTHYLAIDRTTGSNDEICTLDGYHGQPSSFCTLHRNDFPAARVPVSFSLVHRQLDCNDGT